jgi:hypothetical protein
LLKEGVGPQAGVIGMTLGGVHHFHGGTVQAWVPWPLVGHAIRDAFGEPHPLGWDGISSIYCGCLVGVPVLHQYQNVFVVYNIIFVKISPLVPIYKELA